MDNLEGFTPSGNRRASSPLLNYLLVGIVGAIIGGLLTLTIMPGLVAHRLANMQLSYTGSTGGTGISSTSYTTAAVSNSTDPFAVVTAVAEKVSPAVVGIVNKTIAGWDFFGRQYVQDTTGSGVIISSDGYIVTNNHVVDKSKGLTVFLSDGRTLKATLVGADPATDLAVVKVEATGLPTAEFGDSSALKVGQLAVAIGNPLGMDFKRTVTAGVISGLDRVLSLGEDKYIRLIQTDAVINPGNSGGPLVNAVGQVIGLTSSKISGESVEGMGFAIPSNQVKRIAEEIIKTGTVRRARMGVTIADKRWIERNAMDVKLDRGIYVVDVTAGGPAAKAGIKKGDVILEIAGVQVNDIETFQAVLSEKSPGETISVKILRGGTEQQFNVTLGEATQ